MSAAAFGRPDDKRAVRIMCSEATELDLITRATSGDRDALERLLLRHCTQLSQHISNKLPASTQPALSVEDILQQTLLQAYRNIDDFKPRTSRSFSVWLKTIAEHQLHNALKAMHRKKRGGGRSRAGDVRRDQASSLIALVELVSDKGATPSGEVMRHEAVQAIQVAIARLPEGQREAVELHCLEGKSVEEIADQLGRTENAVRGLIHRGKQALRESMGRSTRWFRSK